MASDFKSNTRNKPTRSGGRKSKQSGDVPSSLGAADASAAGFEPEALPVPPSEEAHSLTADEEEALFLGCDRELPPLPDELEPDRLAANSVWKGLAAPPRPATPRAQRALEASRQRIQR